MTVINFFNVQKSLCFASASSVKKNGESVKLSVFISFCVIKLCLLNFVLPLMLNEKIA